MATDSCRIATLKLLKKQPQAHMAAFMRIENHTHICVEVETTKGKFSAQEQGKKNTAELTEIELPYCRLNWNIGKLSQISDLLTPSHESSSIWSFRRIYSFMHSCNKKLQHNTCH